ncbi:hypothetical protein LCGC14_1055410 [marine sediment metagenome]|uniref:Uncharacterized protein n=1 Tax=marine sediment metagenome TaxID=412755 RepID=A0A0F9MS54_9ZZZZ
MNILTRLRFREDDPLRYLHVPKKERLNDDGVPGVEGDTAFDDETGDDTDFDRDEVRNDPQNRGRVVPPEDLQ